MEDIRERLNEREEYLLQLREEKKNALKKTPEGALRVCNSGGKLQYYHRKDAKDTSGVYISRKNISLAEKLAQKDYNERVFHAVERELLAIQKYKACYPVVSAEEIYGNLHKARQKLIVPIKETTEEFVHNWEAVRYEGKGFRTDVPEFYTAKGERVRSKSEVIIADTLYRKGIPYRYEYPLHLSGVGEIYPDFMVLNVRLRKEMYWEHFGRMDDLDYVENTMRKMTGYIQNELFPGDRMICTYETKGCPINQRQISGIIQHYLL